MDDNIASVQFETAVVKDLISPHSFSILSAEPREIELSDELYEKARKIFSATASSDEDLVPREKIPSMLTNFGFTSDAKLLQSLLDKYFTMESISLQRWIELLSRLQTPSYYFGQKFRKYCGRGDLDMVTELIARGIDVNTGDGEGLTGLHYACEANRPEVIQTLVTLAGKALNINAQDKYLWTPLHSAAHHGNIECVTVLLKCGANVSAVEAHGKTPLHIAAAHGRNIVCDALLQKGANLNATDKYNRSAVHDAAYNGQERTYQVFCALKNVDLAIVDNMGYTPEQLLS